MKRPFGGARDYLELVKFEHSIFALPFAYLGMIVAAGGWPGWRLFLWISLAMVAARTLAMGTNRLADRGLDALNPRTANRPLVTGAISLRTAWIGTILSGGVLIIAAAFLGPLPLKLLPAAAVFLIGYSFTKRFTVLSHFFLGFTDGLAPVGAWVAVKGSLFSLADWPAWLLLAVVTFWIGGFDLIYACQDIGVDQHDKLFSFPARYGASTALKLSIACHITMLLLLTGMGALNRWGWIYWVALLVSALLLVWEHRLVNPDDFSRIDLAFFNINGYIALTLFVGVVGSLYFR